MILARSRFTCYMEQGAAACGVRLRWLSGGWLAQLTKEGRSKYVIGRHFPLNDAAAAQIANDKVATYIVLGECGIQAVAHHIFRFSEFPVDEPAGLIGKVLDIVPLPLVVKPHVGSSGVGVQRIGDEVELNDALSFLASRYRTLALSPYVEIKSEYRVVVLDGRARIVYEKCRNGDWRHNLHSGAMSRLVDDGDLVTALSALAQRAMRALDLRFATIDIVDVDGGLTVLEANNTVGLELFSSHDPAHAELARDVYRDAIASCFADGSVPTGSLNGSVPTGSLNGSVPTGSSNGSVLNQPMASRRTAALPNG